MGRITTGIFALCVSLIMISSSFMIFGSYSESGEVLADISDEIASEPPEQPSYTGDTEYHNWEELVWELQNISADHPDITKLTSIGQTIEGREQWVMKISDNPDIEENDEPELFFNGAHHCREWMTIEICLYAINFLTDNYGTNATVTDIVDTRQIWILPLVNPDGRVFDSTGDDPTNHYGTYGWRKNKRDNNGGGFDPNFDGVDINRNYGWMWGASGATSDPTQETYGGPSAFSEPETQNMRDFCYEHDFVFAINYHTYSQLILYPWGWTYANTDDHDLFVGLANEMESRITNLAGSVHDGYVPTQGADLYPTSGGSDDWMYGELGIYSFTIEAFPYYDWVGGGGAESNPAIQPPYDLFHPRADKVIPVCQDNLPAIIYMCQIADNPNQVIEHVDVLPASESIEIVKGTSDQMSVDVLNDGKQDDTYTISASQISGWTVDVTPGNPSVLRNQTVVCTLDITVPAGALPGEYRIWVNATNGVAASDSEMITVIVPYSDDVGVQTISPFVEMGSYAPGIYNIDGLVENFGDTSVPVFNSECTITRFGGGSTVTLFSDDMESGMGQWIAEDWDESHTNDAWQMSTTTSHSSSNSMWCGDGFGYGSESCQIVYMAAPVDLREAETATLSFWTYYNVEQDWDFCVAEVSGDNGQTWNYLDRFTGSATSWALHTYDISNYTGTSELLVRFFFTSDGNTEYQGFRFDDFTIEAYIPGETVVYGPTSLPTSGTLAAGASELLQSWSYDFALGGTYRVSVETTYGSDGNAGNDYQDVILMIDPSLHRTEMALGVGWNLISVPVLIQDESIDSVMASIAGKYDICQYYDAADAANPWKSYNVNSPSQQLMTLNNTMAVWVRVTEACDFYISGEVATTTAIPLEAGWNLVGYPSVTSRQADTTLPAQVTKMAVYNAGQPYLIEELPLASVTMAEGKAYWVYCTSATTWNVDW